jgi:hypothetical protein
MTELPTWFQKISLGKSLGWVIPISVDASVLGMLALKSWNHDNSTDSDEMRIFCSFMYQEKVLPLFTWLNSALPSTFNPRIREAASAKTELRDSPFGYGQKSPRKRWYLPLIQKWSEHSLPTGMLENCGDLMIPKPFHQCGMVNRKRGTERKLCLREIVWNINSCVIFVIITSFSFAWSYTGSRYGQKAVRRLPCCFLQSAFQRKQDQYQFTRSTNLAPWSFQLGAPKQFSWDIKEICVPVRIEVRWFGSTLELGEKTHVDFETSHGSEKASITFHKLRIFCEWRRIFIMMGPYDNNPLVIYTTPLPFYQFADFHKRHQLCFNNFP